MADTVLRQYQTATTYVDVKLVDIGGGLYALATAGQAGTALIGKVGIDQTTPGTTNLVESRPYSRRNAGVLHRNAITAVDKIIDFVTASVTIANVAGTQGFLLANTAHYMTAVPGNRWGPTVPAAIDTVTTTADATNTHVIACTIAAATGAEWYDLFLSTDAAPKWVARITEAQRAAGGEILTFATYSAGASAGIINIGCLGTGIQTTNVVFSTNNAYTPAVPTAINCAGFSKAHIQIKLALTDLRSAPSLSVIPFFVSQVSGTDFFQGTLRVLALLGALGQSLCQDFELDVEGSTGLVILVDAIGGQGAAASIWVELA